MGSDDFESNEDLISRMDEIEMKNRRSSTESNDSLIHVGNKKRRRILSNNESFDEIIQPSTSGKTAPTTKWSYPKGRQQSVIPYTEIPGMNPLSLKHSMRDSKPEHFYALFVPDELFEIIAFQTNLRAEQVIQTNTLRRSRLVDWKPASKNEIKSFFGLILYMGLVKLPKVSDYWSKEPMFGQQFIKSIMSRNRFEIILRMLHFMNNEEDNQSDRLNIIRPLMNSLNSNFELYYTPSESIFVDECMVPFRGRIIFRQYNRQKRHKYGIHLFKLCTISGYTYKLDIYAGKQFDTVNTTPSNVVTKLCQSLFHKGHTLYTDNWYTSVDLAEQFLKNDTHLVGTIRKNRKNMPKEVVNAILMKTGEFRARENANGITVMKWKDERDVLFLSTKHSTNFVKTTNKRGQDKYKPQIVVDYNETKSTIDLSNQITAYSSLLRKTIRWYKKLAIELLLNTALVNAMIIYNSININKKKSVVQFRKEIVQYLCNETNQAETVSAALRQKRLTHEIKRKEGLVRMTRKWCQGCYHDNITSHDRKYAKNKTVKVPTYCPECPSQPHYCLICFNKKHR